MDLNWQLDNPAIALEKYYGDTVSFASKSSANEVLRGELSSKQSELKSNESELSGVKSRLSSMGSYEQGDIDGEIQEARDTAQKKVNDETKKYETKQNELASKRDSDIRDNDNWLKNKLEQLLGENADADRELTDAEKKALEFEIERRKFIVASNERINSYEDAITEEQLSCQTIVGDLKSKQDEVYSKFEPDILKYKKEIDSINKKYQPEIRSCQNVVSEKVANRDEEISQLQNERNREIQLANNEIEGYKREFKQTERQFNEQIRMAKLQNKPTTRMENNKVSRLNAINDNITKVNNRANKKVSSIDQKIDTAQSKHAKHIEKAESQLNAVIHNRDLELSGPTRTYNGLVQDRDSQISTLQSKIDQREGECSSIVSQNNSNIESENRAQSDNNSRIDQSIIDFVMNGDTCFSDVLDEQNAPFLALQSRVNTWMELLSTIKKDKLSAKYQGEHEKQKSILASMDYSGLQTELTEAAGFNDNVSLFAKNTGLLFIAGGSLAALGVALFIVFHVVLGNPVGMTGIVALIIGIALIVFTIIKSNKEFSQICKYVSLASDYKEFPSITSRSTEITKERELAKMKALGEKLYDIYYGKAEVQSIHDAKDADIKADYERNLKLIRKEYENHKAQIERECDAEIKRINDEAAVGEENFNNEKEELQNKADTLTLKIDGLNARIRDLNREIDENTQFIEAFESNYVVFEKKLADEKWMAPMNYTHGTLRESLYIIPESGEADDYNHRKIYRVNHNKKAFVINYDIADVEDGRVEEVNKIIHDLMFDLMYAVYRINSKDTYAQYVIDGMAATNDLKSTNVKNAFSIREVVGKIEDLRGRIKSFSTQREKLAEKGTTMDALNESNYNSQDRPEVYNILYLIFKPDERKSKLDDEIRMLIPECEKYGFLPIFICEKETWERESQEKESIYKDIKGLANSEIVVFDGKRYTMAN